MVQLKLYSIESLCYLLVQFDPRKYHEIIAVYSILS